MSRRTPAQHAYAVAESFNSSLIRLHEQTVTEQESASLAIGFLLVQASFRFSGRAPPSYLEVVSTFWEKPEEGEGRGRDVT